MKLSCQAALAVLTISALVVLAAGCGGSGGGGATKPDPPANLSADPFNERVFLEWDEVSGAEGYKVYIYLDAAGDPLNSRATSETNYIWDGLENGTTYYFAVTAVNAAGESGFSSLVAAAPVLTSETVTLYSQAALDGHIFSGVASTGLANIYVGDDSANNAFRGFLSFDLLNDLPDLPPWAEITGATLSVYQVNCTGTPYAGLGALVADHLDYGDPLDAADYGIDAITTIATPLSTDGTLGWHNLDVTDCVAADLDAGRIRSQYRLRFSTVDTNNDNVSDFTSWRSGNFDDVNYRPKLVIVYGY